MNPDDPALAQTWQPFEEAAGEPDWSPDETVGRAPPPAPPPPLPRLSVSADGVDTPEYRIGEVLGSGGSAVVFAAEHAPLGRSVAIKALHTRIRSPEAKAALVDEARIAGGLSHPNIVSIHALGLDAESRPLLVMERIDGEAWSRLLRQPDHRLWRRWPGDTIDRALHVALRVADALASAHEQGVLHRDVKPSNVILGPTGEVYLVDWGIAARLDADGRVHAPLGGTPAFMAPEMFDPRVPLDARCDVYLLGASLYTALAGRAPRDGDGFIRLARRAADPPPPLPESVPQPLADIVYRALAPDREARHPTVEALRQALVDFMDHRSAIELAERAESDRRRFEALRGARDAAGRAERDAALTEARFGFRTALRAWPEHAAARAGLTALLGAAIDDDLARGDVAAAQRSLAEMPEPDAALEARVDAAAARSAADRAELDAARRREAELDPRAGSDARLRFLPIIGFALIAGPLSGGVMRVLGILPTDDFTLGRALAPLIMAAIVEFGLRRWEISGPGARFNARLARLAQVALIAAGATLLVGMARDSSLQEVTFHLLMGQAVTFGAGAVTLDRRLLIAAGGGLATALILVTTPPLYSEFVLVAYVAGAIGMFQWIWSRSDTGQTAPLGG